MSSIESQKNANDPASLSGELTTVASEIKRMDLLKNHGSKDSNGVYISPSDLISSPASKKLANFKQRQINKQNDDKIRRSLFTRTTSSNSNNSTSSDEMKW